MPRFCEVSRADGLSDVLDEAAGSRGDPGHPYRVLVESSQPCIAGQVRRRASAGSEGGTRCR